MDDDEDRPVTILLDPQDDVRVTAGLLASHDPARGRVVVHPTPAPWGDHVFAHDLLAALGRPVSRFDDEHLSKAKAAWLAAAAWMLTEQIHDLVVLRADRLPASTWAWLLRVRQQAGHQLLLVCHLPQIPPHLAGALAGSNHRVLHDLPTLGGVQDRPPPEADQCSVAELQGAELPSVPAAGVAHYRAEAFRQLDPAAFARFDAVYREGFDAACAWLTSDPGSGQAAKWSAPGTELVRSFLARLAHHSRSRRRTLTLLRGAQAGFLAHGLLLTIPTASDLLTALNGPGLNTVPITGRIVDQIRSGVAHPVVAAAVAAALFTGIAPQALLHGELTADAAAIRAMWRPRRAPVLSAVTMTAPKTATAAIFHVPPPARPLLTAAHHFAGEVLRNPRQRLFTAPQTTTEIVLAAAANSRITLPDPLSDLTATWQIRVTCEPIDAPAPHTYSCARPDWTMLADTKGRKETAGARAGELVRGEHPRAAEGDDRSFGRRPLTTDSAAGALQLIVDHFTAHTRRAALDAEHRPQLATHPPRPGDLSPRPRRQPGGRTRTAPRPAVRPAIDHQPARDGLADKTVRRAPRSIAVKQPSESQPAGCRAPTSALTSR